MSSSLKQIGLLIPIHSFAHLLIINSVFIPLDTVSRPHLTSLHSPVLMFGLFWPLLQRAHFMGYSAGYYCAVSFCGCQCHICGHWHTLGHLYSRWGRRTEHFWRNVPKSLHFIHLAIQHTFVGKRPVLIIQGSEI